MKTALTSLLILLFFSGFSQSNKTIDLRNEFAKYGVDGCFVLYDESKNEFLRYNVAYCDSMYMPASTFKIPNAVIALEEGAVKDTFQVLKWNGDKWPVDNWNRDQTLSSSMKYSCVWVYSGFARQIGTEKYKKYLRQFNYGNQDLSGPADHFWLAKPFAISANQQVAFLRKFYHNKLGVSRRSIDIVKDIIIIEKAKNYTWSGKTGSGEISETEEVLWLAGYLESNNKIYFYTLNFKTSDPNSKRKARYDIARDVFKTLKLID